MQNWTSRLQKSSIKFQHLPQIRYRPSFQQRAMTTEAQTAKKALRKEIKTRLSSLDEATIASQSKEAQNVLLNLSEYKKAKSLSIYLSMPASEAQTDLLVKGALSSGKKVFVPFLYSPSQEPPDGGKKRKVMDMLRLNSLQEYENLARDAWGIPSLSAESVKDRENAMGGKGLTLVGDGTTGSEDDLGGLDLVVVPAVAFDAQMNRLGHGAGFYDAFLERLCDQGKRPKPYLGKSILCMRITRSTADVIQVGLCLAEQLLDQQHKVPTSDWDWKVDAVAVGNGNLLS
jgi:5-formyltetrahydrofolate cyclo-ligase